MGKWLVFLTGVLLLVGVVSAAENAPLVTVKLLNQDPHPARAGDVAELRFSVENAGGTSAGQFETELLGDYPFTVIDGQALQELGTLSSYQSGQNALNIKYRVKIDKDARQGSYNIKLRYRYTGSAWTTVSFGIATTSKELAQIIYVDKAKLEPGKETELKFTISNIGSTPLQNVVFSWSETNGIVLPVFSDDTKYVKYLDVGESTDLVYNVVADVNAQPGLYKLDLTLKYESTANATVSTLQTRAGVLVGGETDFEVAFSESSQGQTSLSVANTGNNPALSVSVKIPEQLGFGVSGSSSAIIGNLDKGDYTLVSFQLVSRGGFANASAFGTQRRIREGQFPVRNASSGQFSGGAGSLDVVIEYTDTTGERRTVEKSVPVQLRVASATGAASSFQGQQQGGILSLKGMLITLAIVIAGLWLYASRKKGFGASLLRLMRRE